MIGAKTKALFSIGEVSMSTLREGLVGKLPIVSGDFPDDQKLLRSAMEPLLEDESKEHFKLFGLGKIPVLLDADAKRAIIFDTFNRMNKPVEFSDESGIKTPKDFITEIFDRVSAMGTDLPEPEAIKMFEALITLHDFIETVEEKLFALDLISFGLPGMKLEETDTGNGVILVVKFQDREEAFIPYDGLSSYIVAVMQAFEIFENLKPTKGVEVKDSGIFMPEKKIYIPE